MANEERRTYKNFRRRREESKVEIPVMPSPAGGTITAKHLGYLHAHCGLSVLEIVARYPHRLNKSLVHLGLHHYFNHEAAFNAELLRESKFNVSDALRDSSMRLPSVDLASLVQVEEMFKSACTAERLKAEKEWEANRLVNKPRSRSN